MPLWLLLALLLVWPGLAPGQESSAEVDQAEVLRRGDLVQLVGAGAQVSTENLFATALGPPASDADKWFISVVSMQGCAGCEQLRRDWATSPWLLALAHPTDPKQSWAHYTVYDREDRSQAFRFEGLKISTFPTVLVQPPRSRRYGDPSLVVYQGVYQGNPERLARDITQAIRRYVETLPPPSGPVKALGTGGVGVDPPWQPVPRVDPWNPAPTPAPLPPSVDPTIPPPAPQPPPAPAFPWSAVVSLLTAGFSLPAALALAGWALYTIRARRQAAGKPPLLDQAALDRVLALLQRLAEQSPPPRSRTRRRSPPHA